MGSKKGGGKKGSAILVEARASRDSLKNTMAMATISKMQTAHTSAVVTKVNTRDGGNNKAKTIGDIDEIMQESDGSRR